MKLDEKLDKEIDEISVQDMDKIWMISGGETGGEAGREAGQQDLDENFLG